MRAEPDPKYAQTVTELENLLRETVDMDGVAMRVKSEFGLLGV